MAPQVFMNYIHSSSLLNQLSSLWKCDQLCDAVITVDSCIVAKAHKLVLLAVSPKLKNDSKSASQNSTILDVCLPSGVDHRAVHALLQYLYEGFLIITEDIAKDLMKIAEFLEIKCLFKCCQEFCIKSFKNTPPISSENMAWLNTKNEDYSHVRKSKYESHHGEKRKRRRSLESGDENNSKDKSTEDRIKLSNNNIFHSERGESKASSELDVNNRNTYSIETVPQKSLNRSVSNSQQAISNEQFEEQTFGMVKTSGQESKLNSSGSDCTVNNSNIEFTSIKQETEFNHCEQFGGQTVFDTSMSTSLDASVNRDDQDVLKIIKTEPASDDSDDCQFVDFPKESFSLSTSHNKNNEHRQQGAGSFYMSSSQVHEKPGSTSHDMPLSDFSVSQMPSHEALDNDGEQASMSFEGDSHYVAGTEQMPGQGPKIGQIELSEPRFVCQVCGKSFNYNYNLNRHMKIHLLNKPANICKFCGKTFSRSDNLRQHEWYKHGIFCHVCGKSVHNKSNLKRHYMAFHSSARPAFSCSVCGKCFSRRDNLRQHEKRCYIKRVSKASLQ